MALKEKLEVSIQDSERERETSQKVSTQDIESDGDVQCTHTTLKGTETSQKVSVHD